MCVEREQELEIANKKRQASEMCPSKNTVLREQTNP